MSHANSAPRVSENNLRDIWDAGRLGSVRRVAPAASGSRNESHIVNDDLFIRFNTRAGEFRKFGNERVAYELLAQSMARVPRVVVLDETHEAMLPGNQAAFVDGYLSVHSLDEQHCRSSSVIRWAGWSRKSIWKRTTRRQAFCWRLCRPPACSQRRCASRGGIRWNLRTSI